jgi:N-acetylmuramoyl-L-alanine amidase CwlA
MIGANTIGGLIGEQNDMAWIGTNTNSKKVNVTIDAVELTKGISYFTSNAERDYCGTIGTLVGQKNQWLYVNSDNVSAKIEGAALLSNARKDALLFKYNVSAATTEQIQEGYKFWGDEKGYVGFAKETSMYFVKNAQQGNYEFNIYMKY